MAQMFADGFESNDYSAWTGTTVTGTATLAVASAAALVGSRGSRSTYSTAGDNNWEAKATKSFTPPVTGRLFAQTAVRLTSVVGVGYSAMGSKAVLAVRAQDGQEQAWFSLRTGGLRFSYRSRSGSLVAVNSSIPLSTGTVAFLRIMVDRSGTSPVIQGWISGNGIDWMDVGAAADGSVGAQGVGKNSGQVEVGVVHIANFEPGSYTIDHDDIVVQDSLGVTDWRIVSNLVQPVHFVSMVSLDRSSTSNVAYRLSASAQGSHDAVAAPSHQFALRSAVTSLREAFAQASQPLTLTQATATSTDHQAETATDFEMWMAMSGNKDWHQTVDVDFLMRSKHHAVMGEIEAPVTVRVSDRAWGSVAVMDSEA